jgi:formyltetrahydrofolate-dependent phosphoribosylglycinamide formyltransferase
MIRNTSPKTLSTKIFDAVLRMLHRLKDKWKVSWPRFVLIFVTFALGGSLCGYLGRKLLQMLAIEGGALKVVLYIVLVTLLWPFCVLLVSVPLGQFAFFRSYLQKMGSRIMNKSTIRSRRPGSNSIQSHSIPNIAIFASGAGTNARKIIEFFRVSGTARVAIIVCNNSKAGVIQVAADNNIPVIPVNRRAFFEDNSWMNELRLHDIELLVLAGFLWKVPSYLIESYPNRIINLHPALLPKYGGKGMYGENVHKAVIQAGEPESGITIHYVDEHYDNGDIIFQAKCPVLTSDTPGSLAERIHALEHEHYPKVLETLVINILDKDISRNAV